MNSSDLTLDNNKKKIVLCGGGTGGHVFPNIAVSEILQKEDCEIYYIGVNGKVEEKVCDKLGIDFYGYDFQGFPRKIQKELFIWPLNLLKAVAKAKVYLKHFKPDMIFGTGGYSSAPVFIAAQRLNLPYIIHNLDVRLGLANKFCASNALLLTLGFDSDQEYPNKKTKVTGNPVRKGFLEIEKTDKQKIYKEFDFDPNKKTVFVIGGSQGANAINENILEILKDLVLNNNIQIIHQTGEATHETFSKRIPSKVQETTNYISKPFFENPEKCYHIADLVISRSGAMTTTEVITLGKPAIFIPFPYAGNHQEANIKHLVDKGGAVLMKQRGLKSRELLSTILELINNPNKLNEMSKITKSLARPNATEEIAKSILDKIQTRETKPKETANVL